MNRIEQMYFVVVELTKLTRTHINLQRFVNHLLKLVCVHKWSKACLTSDNKNFTKDIEETSSIF